MSTNTLVTKKLDGIADLIEIKNSWCDTGNVTWNIKEAGDKCQGPFDFSLNNSMDDQVWSWCSSAIMAMQILARGWTAGELWTLAIVLAFHYIPSSHFCFYPSQVFFLMRIPTFSDEISALPQELTELLWSMHPRFPGKQHKLASATPVSCHFVTHTMRFFSFPSAITLHLTICIVCQDHGKDLFLRCKYTYTHTYKLVLSYS